QCHGQLVDRGVGHLAVLLGLRLRRLRLRLRVGLRRRLRVWLRLLGVRLRVRRVPGRAALALLPRRGEADGLLVGGVHAVGLLLLVLGHGVFVISMIAVASMTTSAK